MPQATATLPLPDPAPPRGLSRGDFTQIAKGGLGDGHNSFAHSMAWFKGRLFLGTTRSNLCMLRVQSSYVDTPLRVWPVDCPKTLDGLYKLDRQSQIWAYDPADGSWEMVYRAPMVEGRDGTQVAREIGYRSMSVYHGPDTDEPALYVSSWAPGKAPGGLLLRSTDGKAFHEVTPYGVVPDMPVSTTRSLTEFRGRMHFAPSAQRGQTGGQQNSARPVILAAKTPEEGGWVEVNPPGFGDDRNLSIFSLIAAGGQLYAGTLNPDGLLMCATDGQDAGDGTGHYKWRMICTHGAGRGPLNQVATSSAWFNGALYIGTGIQGGGIDRVNKVGPAAAEILRINPDDSIDLIVGDRDETDERVPLSGLAAGFGHFFNGYMWAMGVHEGWLYCGSYDWSSTLRWAKMDDAPQKVKELMRLVGVEDIIAAEGGADLWRTADGENWMPVDRRGFGNPYNWGFRNVLSTPAGLMVGTANVFGPTVAVPDGDGWRYVDNPDGGLEVWRGVGD